MALNRPSIPPVTVSEDPKPFFQRRSTRAGIAVVLGLTAAGYWVQEALTAIDTAMTYGSTVGLLRNNFANMDITELENACTTNHGVPSTPLYLVYSTEPNFRARQDLAIIQVVAGLNNLHIKATNIVSGTDSWPLPHLARTRSRALCYRDTAAFLTTQLAR